jgi:predicted helicase
MVEMKSGTHDRGTTLFPMMRYETVMGRRQAATSNLEPDFIREWEQATNTRFCPSGSGDLKETSGSEDVLHWIYGCCYSLRYREAFRAALASGFPIVFMPKNVGVARDVIQLGADLAALHLLDSSYPQASWVRSTRQNRNPLDSNHVRFVDGSREVSPGYPKYLNGEVLINGEARFKGVPSEVWSFYIGGYQVCEKWLKDRKGRKLSKADIEHYQKIVVALHETIRIMAEIDKVIDAHGGWPNAFATGHVVSSKGASSQ